jgi:hypothetical protein
MMSTAQFPAFRTIHFPRILLTYSKVLSSIAGRSSNAPFVRKLFGGTSATSAKPRGPFRSCLFCGYHQNGKVFPLLPLESLTRRVPTNEAVVSISTMSKLLPRPAKRHTYSRPDIIDGLYVHAKMESTILQTSRCLNRCSGDR